ncbi:hypothetical protein K488DRAFT_82539 [Vararia minispora EC-137]|uniref:Uncharacterized protein n=1 Tax=Vararia minispora EC-137 TaxID=1314806 RepID=A0ACB8QW62_9AGAM|nr:hypothetical protein K488DRAFT_82539 [Vararia minispora EC-137]
MIADIVTSGEPVHSFDRGEQFRHELNQRRVFPVSYSSGQGPYSSLPYGRLFGLKDVDGPAESSQAERAPSGTGTAGPIPRSWLPSVDTSTDFDSPAWRADALSIFLAHAPRPPDAASRVPSLMVLCLRRLLEYHGANADTISALRTYLPPRACQVLLRETAVYCPLERASLAALLGAHGHVGGEVIVVGPVQTKVLQSAADATGVAIQRESWDAEESSHTVDGALEEDVGMSGFALVGARLRGVQLLPRCLTRLALIHLPAPAPVHLLPERIPLLEVLDLSFNDWLAASLSPTLGGRCMRWIRWTRLRVLSVRGTGLQADSEVLEHINEGRWVDGLMVEVIA